jgi:Mrp family chromosome partitioning ATPase
MAKGSALRAEGNDTLRTFIGSVEWGHLDYLILDLPPGTGYTQLTLAQSFPHRDLLLPAPAGSW